MEYLVRGRGRRAMDFFLAKVEDLISNEWSGSAEM